PNGGPIFMVQVENEYKNIARHYGTDGVAYLEWLRDLFESYDLGVPLSMCNPVNVPLDGSGWVPRTLETLNSGCANHLVAPFKAKYLHDPCLWTEAWTGWYQIFGGPQRRRSASNMAFYVARFFAAGGKGINYYMWHGGTNFARDAMFLQTPSYDFDAALDEYGQTTPKFEALAELHKVLQTHDAALLQNELPEIIELAERCCACVFPHATDPLVFLCNDGYVDAGAPAQIVLWQGDSYHLPPETLILLGASGVLWQTTVTNEPDEVRSRFIETTKQPLLAESRLCVVPRLSAEEPLLPHPQEQLQFTCDLTDYCWYLTSIEVPQSGEAELTLEGVADFFQVFVDGKRVAVSASHILEDRGSLDGAGFRQSVHFECEAGTQDLAILVCALGLTKGDWMIGANMAQERKGIWGRALWNDQELIGSWQMRAFDPSPVAAFAHAPIGEGPLSWQRLTFAMPAEATSLALDMGAMGKGMLWLNGQCLSRYWLLPVRQSEQVHLEHDQLQSEYKSEPSQRYYHVPREWLCEENELIVFEELGGSPQNIRLCAVQSVKPYIPR
ncbi:MAG TPA: beta-galactosidase, partial [Abditibacteriaceae bacterium]